MKSALVLLGIVLGFAIAHAVNKTPEGKRVLSRLDARIEDFRDAAVEGFRTRNAEVRAIAAEADLAASDRSTRPE